MRGTIAMRLASAFVAFSFLPRRILGRTITGSIGFMPGVSTPYSQRNHVLFAKRRKISPRKSRRRQRAGKRSRGDESASVSDTPDTTTTTSGTATQRPPATLAGVVEDHRYEQFFYDEGTANQLYQLVDMYSKPLLLCNPTLAVLAEKKNRPYLLLDRDTRFHFLSGYRQFSLTEPYLITDYNYDAVFIDPPFANVTPRQVARCLRLMAADNVPLYIAYNSRREDELLESMNALDSPNLERKWPLAYREGVGMETQDSIWLYGPVENIR